MTHDEPEWVDFFASTDGTKRSLYTYLSS